MILATSVSKIKKPFCLLRWRKTNFGVIKYIATETFFKFLIEMWFPRKSGNKEAFWAREETFP